MNPPSPPLRRHALPLFIRRLLFSCASAALAANACAHDFLGEAAVYYRHFPEDALDPRQHGDIGLFTFRGEYWHDWDDGDQRIAFTPYVRAYNLDDARTQADIQELYWRRSFEQAEFSIGVRKYFWGRTESVHLVDILNQTDLVQDIDGEDKLGQPVVDFAFITAYGDFNAYLMPYFRERRFPAVNARVRFPLIIDAANPVYESDDERRHVDFALRWSHYIGAWDIGLSYFDGTAREPRLVPGLNGAGEAALIPHYDQIRQFGIDVQATMESWLWKFEGIVREDRFATSTAAAAGFEYTFYGVADSATDVGVLFEYLYDERATTPFQDDVFAGARLAFNDVQSTELLFGVVYDPDDGSTFGRIEGSRRLGDSWKLAIEGRFFAGAPADSPFAGLLRDDYLEISLAKFF